MSFSDFLIGLAPNTIGGSNALNFNSLSMLARLALTIEVAMYVKRGAIDGVYLTNGDAVELDANSGTLVYPGVILKAANGPWKEGDPVVEGDVVSAGSPAVDIPTLGSLTAARASASASQLIDTSDDSVISDSGSPDYDYPALIAEGYVFDGDPVGVPVLWDNLSAAPVPNAVVLQNPAVTRAPNGMSNFSAADKITDLDISACATLIVEFIPLFVSTSYGFGPENGESGPGLIDFAGGTISARVIDSSGNQPIINSTSGGPSGTIHYVVFQRDSSGQYSELFDQAGVSLKVRNTTDVFAWTKISIGAYRGNNHWTGGINRIRGWTKKLTAGEVANLLPGTASAGPAPDVYDITGIRSGVFDPNDLDRLLVSDGAGATGDITAIPVAASKLLVATATPPVDHIRYATRASATDQHLTDVDGVEYTASAAHVYDGADGSDVIWAEKYDRNGYPMATGTPIGDPYVLEASSQALANGTFVGLPAIARELGFDGLVGNGYVADIAIPAAAFTWIINVTIDFSELSGNIGRLMFSDNGFMILLGANIEGRIRLDLRRNGTQVQSITFASLTATLDNVPIQLVARFDPVSELLKFDIFDSSGTLLHSDTAVWTGTFNMGGMVSLMAEDNGLYPTTVKSVSYRSFADPLTDAEVSDIVTGSPSALLPRENFTGVLSGAVTPTDTRILSVSGGTGLQVTAGSPAGTHNIIDGKLKPTFLTPQAANLKNMATDVAYDYTLGRYEQLEVAPGITEGDEVGEVAIWNDATGAPLQAATIAGIPSDYTDPSALNDFTATKYIDGIDINDCKTVLFKITKGPSNAGTMVNRVNLNLGGIAIYTTNPAPGYLYIRSFRNDGTYLTQTLTLFPTDAIATLVARVSDTQSFLEIFDEAGVSVGNSIRNETFSFRSITLGSNGEGVLPWTGDLLKFSGWSTLLTDQEVLDAVAGTGPAPDLFDGPTVQSNIVDPSDPTIIVGPIDENEPLPTAEYA